jgi:ABC-type antimicrobial peptide transport system permease subunit
VVVNLMGMVVGTGIGYGVSWLLGRLMEDMPTTFSWTGLAMAAGFSVIVGVGFGTLPARRAARLQPVEALR